MREGIRHWFVTGVVVALGLALPCASAGAHDIVYDNFNPAAPSFLPQLNGEEVGDDVTLEGPARVVSNFFLSLTSNYDQDYSGTFTARFYLPDGGMDTEGNPLPGTEIWEGSLNITGQTGTRLLAFQVPEVVVPDTFIWSLQFETNLPNSDVDAIGLDLNDTPGVGSSRDIAYFRDASGDWVSFNFQGQSLDLANLQAQIVADVPEPGMLAMLGIAAAAMMRRRR